MSDMFPITSEQITSFAPVYLENHRASRYLGDDISIPFSMFTPGDQNRTRQLYTALQELLTIVRATMHDRETCLKALREFIGRVGWTGLVRSVQQLGSETRLSGENETLNKVIHDIRGGGFQALSIQLQFIDYGVVRGDDLHRLFFLTRDHLKIMRNAVMDLDPESYERDRNDRLHSVDLLTEKWQRATHKLRDRQAVVLVDCQFQGNVSERCLEFAALDRVLYNLMNNAVRNTADSMVYLVILPFPSQEPENLRFCIYNAISSAQEKILRAQHGQAVGKLFHGGFTTGGTGLGMRICADFVSNAFGIRMVDEALRGGYLGADIIDGYFINWFHWPIAAD